MTFQLSAAQLATPASAGEQQVQQLLAALAAQAPGGQVPTVDGSGFPNLLSTGQSFANGTSQAGGQDFDLGSQVGSGAGMALGALLGGRTGAGLGRLAGGFLGGLF